MPNYNYIALDNRHQPINGKLDEPDRASAISALTKQGLRPISLHEITLGSKFNFDFRKRFRSRKVKSDSLVMMTRQLSAMIGAGVPILRALNSLQAHTEDPALANVLSNVIKDVQGGMSFGDALSKHPETFNDIYVNMVRAGEAAGILDDILKRLAYQQEKNASMFKKVRGAMAYPTVIFCVTILAFFGLMIFIIPKIGKILTDLGGPNAHLPGITLFMLGVSNIIVNFWYLIFPAIAGLIYGVIRYLHTPHGRSQFHHLVLKIPAVSPIIRKVAVARFARTFSALMGAGVAVLECLHVTARAMGNVVYEDALNDAAKQVKNGKQLSNVLANNPLFPPIVSQMLSVGEETGQTDAVLVKVADFYEEEVDNSINSLSSIIEPVIIVVMGSMVGLIAASVMLPIAQLSTSIQQ
jgi:type IV pilus assembly protein PilC